ncbi:MAG: hypothetical protein GXX83_10140 [Gaiellales bacterium]|nr:hypothetical protein [Gaiellales bacterium]
MIQGAGNATEMKDVITLSALILEVLIEERGKGAPYSRTVETNHPARYEPRWSWVQQLGPPG